MDFNPAEGTLDEKSAKNAFLDRGMMVARKHREVRNTTISAIVVLKRGNFVDTDYQRDLNRKLLDAKWKRGRLLTPAEWIGIRNEFAER